LKYIFLLRFRNAEYLEEVAVQIAKDLAENKIKPDRKKKGLVPKVLDFGLKYNFVRDQIFGKAKASVLKLTGGHYPAPLKVRTLPCNTTTFYFLQKMSLNLL